MTKNISILTLAVVCWIWANGVHAFELDRSADIPGPTFNMVDPWGYNGNPLLSEPALGLPLYSSPEYSLELEALDPQFETCRETEQFRTKDLASCLGAVRLRLRVPL